jgi:hypothetical protein
VEGIHVPKRRGKAFFHLLEIRINRTGWEDCDVGMWFGLRSQPDPKVIEKL